MPEIGTCTKCGRTIRYEDVNEDNEENRLPPGNKKSKIGLKRAIEVLVEGDLNCQHHLIIKVEDTMKDTNTVRDLSDDELDKVVEMYNTDVPVVDIAKYFNMKSTEGVYRILKKKGRKATRGKGKRTAKKKATKKTEWRDGATLETFKEISMPETKIAVPELAITTVLNVITMLRHSYSLDDDEIKRVIYIMAAAFEERK